MYGVGLECVAATSDSGAALSDDSQGAERGGKPTGRGYDRTTTVMWLLS